MKLALADAIAATAAVPVDCGAAPGAFEVCTDTRSLRPGDAFLALHGERFDGHDYAAQAVERGASLLVLDRPQARPKGAPALLVPATLPAYMTLGGLARRGFEGRVVGITGSAGKTTTKAFLEQLAAARYGDRVLAAPANENNEIGVSKLLLAASNERHDVLIVEMGARHYGDIAALVAIVQPQIGVLTNVGEAHLAVMGSRERLEETKWALFGGGARAVLNAADDASRARAGTLAHPPHWFAAHDPPNGGLPARGRVTALLGGAHLIDARDGHAIEHAVDVRVPGLHNRANLAAAIAAALDLGVEIEALIARLPTMELPQGRFQQLRTPNGMRIIYDAYNANASGMIAALDAFFDVPARRRIAVLGSMAELGNESEALHERVGAHAALRADVLLVGGEFAVALARGARSTGCDSQRVVQVASNADAARWLRDHANADDAVLLKGSRKYKLEEIVQELIAS